MEAQYCLLISDWPCLGQSVWAAWTQVSGALVALFLAIYMPIRMRRIDELDRQETAAACLRMLFQLGDYYVKTLPKYDDTLGVPAVDLSTAIIATRAHMQNPATPAWMLPGMGHAIDASEKMLEQWKRAAIEFEYRKRKEVARNAQMHMDRIIRHRDGIDAAIGKFRAKHWISLLFV